MHHVLCGLAANPSLPPDLVDRLIAVADADLAEALACRPGLSRAQVSALATGFEAAAVRLAQEGLVGADDVDPAVQPRAALALLEEGAGRPEWARLFAADAPVEHRERLAGCPGLPPDVALTLAADVEVGVVSELALWTTAPEVAARLARHPHTEVRRAVAANEATPPALLAALLSGEGLPAARCCPVCDRRTSPFVHDPHCPEPDCDLPPGAACDGSHESAVHRIHQAALGNPATPAAAAEPFADHASVLLRQELAARPDLSPQVYARLADDSVPWVRARLAENPAIGESLIRRLATDPGHDVRRRLAHHPSLPLDVLVHLAGVARTGPCLLPRLAAASPAEVEELAASPAVVRMLLAQRRNLPDDIRDALAHDPDAKVVKSVAPHPGLSDAQLRAMVERHGAQVVAGVAANPDTTPALLEHLARQRPPVRKALREIARHRHATAPALLICLTDHRARPLAAGHPHLPPRAIVELLADEDWQTVEAAAANPSLPATSMADLVP
ncbi:hypothetical protein ACFYUY_12895 [Kitasatospora sp. NPDC004745]|uniref:hypothetical protein n=1 Tax=Kitasatospora sp. NPDC004745 TaxID=3364019 RepID=UPI00367BD40F